MSRHLLSSRPGPFAAGILALTAASTTTHAQGTPSGAIVSGTVDQITLDDPGDVWSGGQMVVGGQVVIIPRNLVLQLPAAWITLQQLHTDAPPAALAAGKTGLATMDGLGPAAIATVHGNRSPFGNLIAGDVFIEKGVEVLNGTVTYINYTDGYLMVDGILGDPTTGEMVRINDPTGRYTIQQGLGCDGGPNCSADPRFGVDPDNYTITFSTGYPAGIPSTVPVGQRPGFSPGDDAAAAADASGAGDPFCPQTNRGVNPVPDSTRFAPITEGDSITAEGNFEYVGGVRFLSAHTLSVFASLTTIDSPDQPDYLIFDEVEWDAPAFDNQRQRILLIGFTTLNASAVDIYSLQVDTSNVNHELPLASTVGNPRTVNQGLVPGTGGIFKIRYDIDFLGGTRANLSACENLANAGFPTPCSSLLGTNAENLQIMLPLSREIQARSRHQLNPGVITRDISGLESTNGQYLTPIGVGFPEFVEIDLAALQTPFSFDGLSWNNDRRLGPAGCVGTCETTPQPLSPFPVSNRDPGSLLPAGSRQRMLGVYPFSGQTVQYPPAQPPALPITVTPIPPKVGLLPAAPVADFGSSSAGGTVPVVVSFTSSSSGGAAAAQLWDFGDGTFSIEANPVHTFTTAGTFDVALTLLNGGGTSTVTKAAAIVTQEPGGGGPGAPTANFSVDRTAGNAPLTVNFADTSVGEVTSWLWAFGDGATSTLQNPAHVYDAAGLYSVTLTVSGPGGSNTTIRPDLISVSAQGGLEVDFLAIDPTTGPAPLRIRFRAINVTGIATSGVFDFGDGTTGTVGNGTGRIIHTYQTPGVYTVTLTATDGTNTAIAQKVDFVTVQ